MANVALQETYQPALQQQYAAWEALRHHPDAIAAQQELQVNLHQLRLYKLKELLRDSYGDDRQAQKFGLGDRLQRKFDEEFPSHASRRQQLESMGKRHSYNIVHDVVNAFEFAFEHIDDEQTDEELVRKWNIERANNWQTNSRERYGVDNHEYYYTKRNGKLYADFLSTSTPFLDIIDDGLRYQREHGSKELIREERERDAYAELESKMSTYPPGAFFVTVCPPGIVEEDPSKSNYQEFFVDIGRDGKMVRFSLPLPAKEGKYSKEEYDKLMAQTVSIIRQFNPGFTVDPTIPIDAQIIGNVFIFTPDRGFRDHYDLFERYFPRNSHALKESVFLERILPTVAGGRNSLLSQYIQEIHHTMDCALEVLLKDDDEAVGWQNLAILFNQMMRRADQAYRDVMDEVFTPEMQLQNPLLTNIVGSYDSKNGIMTVSGNCGVNEGIDMGSLGELMKEYTLEAVVENSVAKFSQKGKDKNGFDYKDDPNLCHCGQGGGKAHFHCPPADGGCGHAIIVGEGTENCPGCGKGKVC